MKNPVLVLTLAALVFAGCSNPPGETIPYLYQKTEKKGLISDKPDNLITSFAVEVKVSLLREENVKQLRLLLPGKEVIATREHSERNERGEVWFGKVDGEAGSTVVFTESKGIVAGNIRLQGGALYQLRFAGAGVYELQELDGSKFQDEGESIRPQRPNEPPQAFDSPCLNTDPPNSIDVMVAYTATTRAAVGGTDAMLALIYLAVYESNLAYANSAVTQRLRLVHTEEVTYAETGVSNTDLTRLQNPSDGLLDALHTSRDAHSADCVVFISEALDACGLGYMMTTVTTAFASYAFSVVKRSCATGYFSFAHELGHNMGADHDCVSAGTGAYPYNRGWVHPSTTPADSWRTVMSYQTTPSSTRIAYFSNPGINYGGSPMGSTSTTPCLADNHLVFNNTSLTVANFRCHSSHATNVWMKDTWNDTGVEPDPATAAEDMWVSPYIWVRNAQDAGELHQHQHENPKFGLTNWIYIKLHNGGAAASGNLRVYYANASVSLTWPSGWTQIGPAIPMAIGASSTDIAEVQWSGLPGTGHFCLLARWESSTDPMTVPETSDINANTRNNNNIAWRNINIVTPDLLPDVVFNFKNVDRRSILRFKFDDAWPNKSFARDGIVRIEFDPETTQWVNQSPPDEKLARRDGKGFILTGESNTVDFLVPSDEPQRGQATIRFSRKPTTPYLPYVADVSHMQKTKTTIQTVGGIRYEIH